MRQSFGEYAERFEACGLKPVLSLPEEGLFVRADGRLLWRILDNLLSNACKYSLRGTRVYAEGSVSGGRAVITIRNISKAALDIETNELFDRFVRGDAARSSEGSGLGLSIARSLAELQGGALELFVDGDLFKAIIKLELLKD